MKKAITTFVMAAVFCACAFAQGKSISKLPKIMDPYIAESGDTLKVGQTIQLLDTSGSTDNFKFVQLLNRFNEPVQPATTRMSMKKDDIKFFKEQDGVMYVFTEYFCFSADMALLKKEVRIVKK